MYASGHYYARGDVPVNPNINYPVGLPRLAQDYTSEQRAAVVAWLSSLTLDELRERQRVLRARVAQVAVSPQTCEAGTLGSLSAQREILTEAVLALFHANFANGLDVKKNSGPLA
jgi:hypothetical protein